MGTYYETLREKKAKILKLKELIKSNSTKKEGLYKEFAWQYFSLGYYKFSLKFFELYLKVNPNNFEYWEILAELYENEKKFKKAIRCYENAEKYATLEGDMGYAEFYRNKINELKETQNLIGSF